MERKKCIQFAISVLSLAVSLALDLAAPDVKSLLCLPLPTTQGNEAELTKLRPDLSVDPVSPINQNTERIK